MKCSHRGNETFPAWEQIASRRLIKSQLGSHDVLLLIVEVPIRNVVVPIGSRPNYVNAEGWKKFKNIVEFDPNDIKEVNIVIDKNVRLYDLSGRQLKKLHKGLNIIDGKKVLVR